jgi:hypothetical protein
MQPQITYYRTQTTEQFVMPSNNQPTYPNGNGGRNVASMGSVGGPGYMGSAGGGGSGYMGSAGGGGGGGGGGPGYMGRVGGSGYMDEGEISGGMGEMPGMGMGIDMNDDFNQQFKQINQTTRGMNPGGGNNLNSLDQEFPHMKYRVPDASMFTRKKNDDNLEELKMQEQRNHELRVQELRNREIRNREMINRKLKQPLQQQPMQQRQQSKMQPMPMQQPMQQPMPMQQNVSNNLNDTRMQEMESELTLLRKKTMIQDKLLKKIKKQALSSMNPQQ